MISSQFEQGARARGFRRIAGVDEAGRGPLAGPVVAAACILPSHSLISGVNDSKKLSPKKREELFAEIQRSALFGIGIVEAVMIDQINILKATLEAMLLALQKLDPPADYFLVDGRDLPDIAIPGEAIVEGDAQSFSIAAASILAKVTRDALMQDYHQEWPQYGFDQHKGYPTRDHLQKLREYGPCPIHRRTFTGVVTCERA